ncbi:type I-E CRISPR-associated protein Cse2/CasB [Streptomyces sp. NPDC001941]|uniref:type I-E CRISPR-associated protein Cse2/CasB n=1 Tax=Streptomyces sp. NPDC001941 TaxID=3154659 RepID=UPI0033242A23
MTAPAPDPQPTDPGPPQPPPWLTRSLSYMEHVARVCATPGGRADLASCQSPRELSEPFRMLPHVRSRIPGHHPDTRLAYLATTAWYAAHAPNPRLTTPGQPALYQPEHGNLGWSLARAVRAGLFQPDRAGELLQDLVRKRRTDHLVRDLQPAIHRLATERVPLSWPRLLCDLTQWRFKRLDIADRWMNAHYSYTPRPTQEESSA